MAYRVIAVRIETNFLRHWEVASWAANTTVVKVLAYRADSTVSQGAGWFAASHVLVTDYHVVRAAVNYEVIYADGMYAAPGCGTGTRPVT